MKSTDVVLQTTLSYLKQIIEKNRKNNLKPTSSVWTVRKSLMDLSEIKFRASHMKARAVDISFGVVKPS
jgi:hypothetical protein